ncbi:ribose-phosphate diphosphokinase [Rhizorhapis sp. SPR117]|uniref:ribose-phosphate diphosphokinase n=1 Tax=Rhizorhapis sp. SPR117 TaxID=2912611 RepID=UPI001F1CD0DE|nr:ribose-phosphate diphosphokinase [Rhizorhapis sp. SPR117]
MNAIVLGFSESAAAAAGLARQLDLPCGIVAVHHFPDQESLVRVPRSAETVILYRSLDDPNAKLIELIFAAEAARDGGARRVILIVPYLAYMRQDMAFLHGEAVSQRIIGRLIAQHFDAVMTVDPHLHRVASLQEVVPGIAAVSLSAAPLLAGLIDRAKAPIIIGPDSESRQWTQSIAGPLGLDMLVGRKERRGDRQVELAIDGLEQVRGRPAILVDDVISSGMTLIAAASLLRDAGASHIEVLATHCLASEDDLVAIRENGVNRIQTTDSVAGPTASVSIAPLLADALIAEGLGTKGLT